MGADNKWLVKSSDHILGPFEFDRVVEDIFRGDIHLLDEIKGPFERWRPIKDHSLFAAAIEKLKATTYSRREGTVTATLDLGTRTGDMTLSKTPTQTHSQTVSPVESEPFEETVVVSTNHQTQPIQQAQVVNVASHGRRFSVMFMVSFLVLGTLGLAYMLYEFKQTKIIEEKVSAYGQWTDQGIAELKTGRYQQALSFFQKAYNIAPNDPNLVFELAPLLVQFDGQFSQVEVMVSNLLAANSQKDFSKRGKTIIGLTQSYRQRWKDAISSYDEVLAIDDSFLPAHINKSYALLRAGDPQTASQLMQKVVTEHPEEAISHFLYVRTLIETGLKTKNDQYFEEALSVSTLFPQRFSVFKQEVLFLVSFARLQLKQTKEEIEAAVLQFLRVDFELTQLHVQDTLIDFQIFNWLDFNKNCIELSDNLSPKISSMLKGFCKLKMNQTIEAKKIFETLIVDNSSDGVLQSLYASALLKLDDLSQVKNTLGFLDQVEDKQPLSETILRGCLLKSDLGCAEALFKGRHSNHISLLYSHWGNSEIHVNSSRRKSKNSVQLGLELSPSFAPLIKLKSVLQNE